MDFVCGALRQGKIIVNKWREVILTHIPQNKLAATANSTFYAAHIAHPEEK
jgi:hypothetical protein